MTNALPSRRSISPESPRKKMKDKRRAQLIDANMECIARYGLTETTISHISETAGMSRGIINFYFTSKEHMMRETLSHLMQEQTTAWREALDKSSGKTPYERLEEGVKAIFSARLCTRKKLSVWAAFVAHAATHPTYRYIFETETGRTRDEIAALAGMADPLIDAPGFANGFICYIRGLRMELLIGDTGRTRQDLEKEALAFLSNIEPLSHAQLTAQRAAAKKEEAKPELSAPKPDLAMAS
jgi:TetR/AcrR family transcriptional repressor of bet genes